MGQKVSPIGLRVGVNRNWDSRWYANDQDFAGLLHEDIKIREYLLKKLKTASVAKVEIERSKNRVTIFVHTSRPGVVIGKDGEAVDALRKEVSKMVKDKQVFINIVEIKNPDVIQSFTNALQKGMDFVQNHTPEEIAAVIAPQFPETDLNTITTIVTRYYDQKTWKEDLIFEKDSFELLENILEESGELKKRVPYEDLVRTDFSINAAKK